MFTRRWRYPLNVPFNGTQPAQRHIERVAE